MRNAQRIEMSRMGRWRASVLGGVTAAAALTGWWVFGQGVPDPALRIALSGTNQVQLTITNGVSHANYEIYRRQLWDPLYPWGRQTVGSLGQTNFTIAMGIEQVGFFRATPGLDWDQDGTENWRDGDPSDGNVGALTVTIERPTQGETLE